MIMVVVVQVLSNMNVAELVDFVKVSSTNGELPDGHHLMMIMIYHLQARCICTLQDYLKSETFQRGGHGFSLHVRTFPLQIFDWETFDWEIFDWEIFH